MPKHTPAERAKNKKKATKKNGKKATKKGRGKFKPFEKKK